MKPHTSIQFCVRFFNRNFVFKVEHIQPDFYDLNLLNVKIKTRFWFLFINFIFWPLIKNASRSRVQECLTWRWPFSADFPDSPPFISFSWKVSLIFLFLFVFLRNFFTKQKNSLRHSTDTFTRNLKCNLYFAVTIIFSVSESPLLGVHLNMQMNVFIEFINISEVIETFKKRKVGNMQIKEFNVRKCWFLEFLR